MSKFFESGGAFCEMCQFLWAAFLMGGCAYIVFWKGHSGWWFLLAVLLVTTKCKKSEGAAVPEDTQRE